MSNHPGIFCISVDTPLDASDSASLAQRRQDLSQLLHRAGLPSNWTTATPPEQALPDDFEVTVAVAKQLTRAELVIHLRRMNAALAHTGRHVASVVFDQHEAQRHWDVLVRQGCHVVRPRTTTTSADQAHVVRGGLWFAPLSCSFVGGSRRSVRTLFSVCQRRLVSSANRGGLFHLNIDIGNARSSWREELDALRALLQTASELRNKQRLQCLTLSELPRCVGKKPATPMSSVLRRAA